MAEFNPLDGDLSKLKDATLLISASAGTGKTWTVAHLATRWLLDNDANDPSSVLMVTYSKAAAAELRSRLRARVAEVGHVLADPGKAKDEWMESLAGLSEPDRERLVRRQEEVLSGLEDVNARTIHSFASMVARSGSATTTAGDLLYERAVNETLTRASLVDLDDLRVLIKDPTDSEASTGAITVNELKKRLLKTLRSSASIGGLEGRSFARSKARLIGRGGPSLAEGDQDSTAGDVATPRMRATEVFERLVIDAERRTRALMAMENDVTFDEMISDVYWEVQANADQAVDSLRNAFGFVLIDEFQDTDAAQWSIFESVFRGHVPVVIVGDPKQAIYGFRGGDVVIFQRLLAQAATDATILTWSLDRNFRSTKRLVGQLNAFFSIPESPEVAQLWSESGALYRLPRPWGYSTPTQGSVDEVLDIRYSIVDAARTDTESAIGTGGLVIRDLTSVVPLARLDEAGRVPPEPPWGTSKPDDIDADAIKEAVFDDVVLVVRGLRDDGVLLDDICILVRTNYFGTELRNHLRRHGIAAVTTKTEPVYQSPSADHVRCLLWALCEPTNPRRGGLLKYTWFANHELEVLASMARTLETHGPGALCRRVLDTATMHDVLRSGDPERHWTDLDHLFALLGEQFPSGVVAAAALGWLEEMMAGSKEADEDAAAVRRVESHGGSLTVMSIHSSKGLEFPVVLCPQIENSPAPSKQSGVLSTPEGREFDLQRLVADKIAEANEGGVDEALQTSDEAARLIYVAMTRAKRDLVVWITDRDRHEWGATAVKPKQILSTSLLRVLVESSQLATAANLEIIAARTGGKPFDSTIEVIRPHDEGESKPLEPIDAEIKEIDLGGVTERPSIDESLRRWSYSALHVHGTSEQTTVVDVDNEAAGYDGGSQSEDVISDAVVGGRLGSKLFGGYAGSEVGNAIHEVFELTVGVLSADDSEKVTSLVGQAFTAQGLSLDDVALGEVTNQFVRLLKTPLGELFDHVSLDELCQRDGIKTANEMRFTLPLEGTGLATDRLIEIGRIASEAEPDGPYAGFFSSLAKGEYRPKRLFQGFLVGSIDLVAEVGDPGRFVVLDYKSNLLKEASSYAPDELRGEMVLSGYPLQGLLYSVALHRFLARRHKDYSPEQHLGGICYLYVRGPLLEDQCPDAGLATWKIPAQIVVGVSDLLAGKRDA